MKRALIFSYSLSLFLATTSLGWAETVNLTRDQCKVLMMFYPNACNIYNSKRVQRTQIVSQRKSFNLAPPVRPNKPSRPGRPNRPDRPNKPGGGKPGGGKPGGGIGGGNPG